MPGPWSRWPGAPAHRQVLITVDEWEREDFDPRVVDARVAEATTGGAPLSVRVQGPHSWERAATAALQVITRYQRFLDARNPASHHPLFDRALAMHRALHDPRKPLVAADFDHTRDTWRWLLRLDPAAGLAVQLAALFHDIERLQSEAEVRVEQHSRDYLRFKEAHAAGGAQLAGSLLRSIGSPQALVDQVAALIVGHEQPGAGADKQLLNEADALSFFSLNACGFAAYYGPEHTARKVAFTLDRLSPRGWRELSRIRHRADFQALIASATPRRQQVSA